MVARPVSTSLGLEGQGQTEPDKNAGNQSYLKRRRVSPWLARAFT